MTQEQFYQQFKNKVLGKGYDVDGAYGNQCWDLYAKYSQDMGVPVFHCTSSGYVKDLWTLRKTSGILDHFSETRNMKPGDVVIFKEVAGITPYSHVAIFDSDVDGVNGLFLGQNQGAPNGAANIVKLPYSATYSTAFRPKKFKGAKEDKVEENKPTGDFTRVPEDGTATVLVSAVRIRNYPSTSRDDTGLLYQQGDVIKYDSYVINDGFVWISYVSDSGVRRYVAAGEVNSEGVNVVPYCEFK